jgi:hypothetical protein
MIKNFNKKLYSHEHKLQNLALQTAAQTAEAELHCCLCSRLVREAVVLVQSGAEKQKSSHFRHTLEFES